MPRQPLDLALKQLRRKIWLQNIISRLLNGLLAAAALSFLCLAAAHLYPLLHAPAKALYLGAAALSLSLAAGLASRPGLKRTAAVGDGLGLEERLTTYLEYRERDFPLAPLFLAEAENTVRNLNPPGLYRISVNGKKLLAAAVLIVLAWGVYFLPSEARREAREKEEIVREIQREAEKIKTLRQQLAAAGQDPQSKDTLSVLKSLERNLNRSGDFNRAAAEVAAAQKELGSWGNKPVSEIMEALAGLFEGAGAGAKGLPGALRSGDLAKAAALSAQSAFSAREQKNLLDNLSGTAANALSPGAGEELARLKTLLADNALTGAKLQEIMRSLDTTREKPALEEELAVELQQSKQRLLARAQKGEKSPGGRDYLTAFAPGETGAYNRAEALGAPGSDPLAGGPGGRPFSGSQGVGGGGAAASGEGTGAGAPGRVARQEQAVRPGGDGAAPSRVLGKLGDQGLIVDKTAPGVPAQTGELQLHAQAWASFGAEDTEHLWKHRVPLQRRELVMEYFQQLNGGN
ncbi:MAG: hypothetical protein MJA84_17720 [Firmicutes bacterium]|nr:hypothetical protein [Bacillota bacterium]